MNAKIKFLVMLIIWGNFPAFSQKISRDVYNLKLLPKFTQDIYVDVAKNIVNENVMFRAGLISTLKIREYQIQAGLLGSYTDQNIVSLKGWFINLGGNFRIKRAHFEGSAFYSSNPFSAIIHETNWGFTLGYNSRHFDIKLGNNYRIYKFTRNTLPENKLKDEESTRIVEPTNIMYSFTYFIMPADHKWNVSLTITDFDHFLIQQETNPMGACKFSYQLNSRLRLYSELWYQNAGMLNLQANYFGLNFRTGLIWNL